MQPKRGDGLNRNLSKPIAQLRADPKLETMRITTARSLWNYPFSLISRYTDASLPWADSFLFAMSLVASVCAAQRNIESCWMWIQRTRDVDIAAVLDL
jgi:hypothetical protein